MGWGPISQQQKLRNTRMAPIYTYGSRRGLKHRGWPETLRARIPFSGRRYPNGSEWTGWWRWNHFDWTRTGCSSRSGRTFSVPEPWYAGTLRCTASASIASCLWCRAVLDSRARTYAWDRPSRPAAVRPWILSRSVGGWSGTLGAAR